MRSVERLLKTMTREELEAFALELLKPDESQLAYAVALVSSMLPPIDNVEAAVDLSVLIISSLKEKLSESEEGEEAPTRSS